MIVEHIQFETASTHQHLTVFKHPQINNNKKLMLLHGAGVAGELTWTFLANYLNQWSEIYAPDLAGMGQSSFKNNQQPFLTDYGQQLNELLTHLNLSHTDFDYGGYSFGGMVLENWLQEKEFAGKVFLIEPAMLFSNDLSKLQEKANQYEEIAQAIEANPTNIDIYIQFLDAVSPNRSNDKRSDSITIQRLQSNPLGFSHSLKAVAYSLESNANYYINWRAPWCGASFVGELTPIEMHQRHTRLSQESFNWQYHSIASSDHSLVFVRPRSIAKVVNIIE